MAEGSFLIRDVAPTDASFIFASFLNGYRRSNFARSIPAAFYFEIHHRIIEAYLTKARPGLQVRVACDPDDADSIFGYIISEGQTLHHVYVKQSFRRLGVGRALVSDVGLDPSTCQFTHLFPETDWLFKKFPAAKYNPYAL